MSESTPGAHKRRRELDQGSAPDDASNRLPKKQKRAHPARPPPSFWDNLSSIPLTRSALEELDRRVTESLHTAHISPPTGVHAVTRSVTAASRAHDPTAVEYLGQYRPARLHLIKRWARNGGPNLSDLRGYHRDTSNVFAQTMSSSQSSLGRRKCPSLSKKSTLNTSTTKSTRPYDRAFQQHLIDFGIYPEAYRYPDGKAPPRPENLEKIKQALAQRRESLSSAEVLGEEFRKFCRADADAAKERQVTSSVIPLVQGVIDDRKCVAREIPLTNLDHLTDGSLVPGSPDLYYGARPEQLDLRVRTKLDSLILPSTQKDLPIMPNFFLAAKGEERSPIVASRQACYDGALGARGIHSVQSFTAGEPVFDNKAYVITSIYQSGQLRMYTCHPIQPTPPRARPEYVMVLINSWSLTGSAEAFRAGVEAYRNGMDWAKAQRDESIKKANDKIATGTPDAGDNLEELNDRAEDASQNTITPTTRHPDVFSSLYDSDTSTDELSMDWPQAKRATGPMKL